MADMNRRNVLLGLGTAAAGSGIVFGSGAFTQLEADRDVRVGVVTDDGGQIELTEGGVDTDAFTAGDGSDGQNRIELDQDGILEGATVELGEFDGEEPGQLDGTEVGFLQVENALDEDSNLDVTVDVAALDGSGTGADDFDSFEVATRDQDAGTSVSVVLDDGAETAVQFGFRYTLADSASADETINVDDGISITATRTGDGTGSEAFDPA